MSAIDDDLEFEIGRASIAAAEGAVRTTDVVFVVMPDRSRNYMLASPIRGESVEVIDNVKSMLREMARAHRHER